MQSHVHVRTLSALYLLSASLYHSDPTIIFSRSAPLCLLFFNQTIIATPCTCLWFPPRASCIQSWRTRSLGHQIQWWSYPSVAAPLLGGKGHGVQARQQRQAMRTMLTMRESTRYRCNEGCALQDNTQAQDCACVSGMRVGTNECSRHSGSYRYYLALRNLTPFPIGIFPAFKRFQNSCVFTVCIPLLLRTYSQIHTVHCALTSIPAF